jgi:RNA polymerase sigma-70 factor, ECF subfamily
MLRLAMAYVRDRETAEDVVQETWITFLRTLDRFQGRSSLRTWLFGILTNVARARRRRESRLVTFTSLLSLGGADWRRPTVDRARFASDSTCRTPPPSWSELPEKVLESRETLAEVQSAIDGLPTKLREVMVLRDVVVDAALRAVSAFAVSGGYLTELAGSPFALPAAATPFGIVVTGQDSEE